MHRCLPRHDADDGGATPVAALRAIRGAELHAGSSRITRRLLVLDDAHLGGDDVVDEIVRIVSAQQPPGIDVVLALRPRQCGRRLEEALELGTDFGRVARFDLGPLDDVALQAVTPQPAPAELRRRSAGNPFALRTLPPAVIPSTADPSRPHGGPAVSRAVAAGNRIRWADGDGPAETAARVQRWAEVGAEHLAIHPGPLDGAAGQVDPPRRARQAGPLPSDVVIPGDRVRDAVD